MKKCRVRADKQGRAAKAHSLDLKTTLGAGKHNRDGGLFYSDMSYSTKTSYIKRPFSQRWTVELLMTLRRAGEGGVEQNKR